MWQYGSSLNTATSRPRTTSAMRCRSSSVATPPVGLCGEFKKIARGDGSSSRNRSMSATVGRKPFACSQRRQHGARAAALDVRQVRRKIRAEDEHAVARVQERLAEELLEHLGAGADHDVARLGRDVELLAHELGGRRAKLGHARRRAIVRLVVLDRLHAAGPRRRRAVERAVADLELDDVLAGGLQRARHREHGESRLDGQRAGKITELCGHEAPLEVERSDGGLGRARSCSKWPRPSRRRRAGRKHSTGLRLHRPATYVVAACEA